ncbi:nuclear export factor [Schizosaccharomyces japonicus yFS275]|uniref:Nuclear export factor n=1 Tax=Schizosaccharomyces japonicus (strain yFS275 / FY16936) TaxID=402676 RepID=B6K7E7_SCHJY|nr:nuclear export factor [Schizosaccharomyces japonicus yFS275]EEB09451.1 nuclear export factor [Schizosaccharomyces japonicus yFS275]
MKRSLHSGRGGQRLSSGGRGRGRDVAPGKNRIEQKTSAAAAGTGTEAKNSRKWMAARTQSARQQQQQQREKLLSFPVEAMESDEREHSRTAARAKRFAAFESGNRYKELRLRREKEQAEWIARQSSNWRENETLVGTCMDMCPEFEREEREFHKSVHPFELDPVSKRIARDKAVKAYHRPAAGNGPILPSDVRPPRVLKKTVDYLLRDLLQRHQFQEVHSFLRDRLRAVCQDFSVQATISKEAVYVHEQIARFHVVAINELSQDPLFSMQQELEQLNKVLYVLDQLYNERRCRQKINKNEAEFRTYMILLDLPNPSIVVECQKWPISVLQESRVQAALRLHALAQKSTHAQTSYSFLGKTWSANAIPTDAAVNLYTRFFKILRRDQNVTFLMACLLQLYIPIVRQGALMGMRRSFLSAHAPYPAQDLKTALAFSTDEQLLQFCKLHNLSMNFDQDNGELVQIELSKRAKFSEPSAVTKDIYDASFAQIKRPNASLSEIICFAGRNDRQRLQGVNSTA